jgi:hypothetical protein
MSARLFLDFDGVLNVLGDAAHFHDDAHFDADREAYAPIDGIAYHLRWSGELADRLSALFADCEATWLSTWEPYVGLLEPKLGWDPHAIGTVKWYDPVTWIGRSTGKLETILSAVQVGGAEPIIWVDDEECGIYAKRKIERLCPAMPVLMVRPSPMTGISKRQLALIEHAVHGGIAPGVTLDDEARFSPTSHQGL